MPTPAGKPILETAKVFSAAYYVVNACAVGTLSTSNDSLRLATSSTDVLCGGLVTHAFLQPHGFDVVRDGFVNDGSGVI